MEQVLLELEEEAKEPPQAEDYVPAAGDRVIVTSANFGKPFEGTVRRAPYKDGFGRWNIVVSTPRGDCIFMSYEIKPL